VSPKGTSNQGEALDAIHVLSLLPPCDKEGLSELLTAAAIGRDPERQRGTSMTAMKRVFQIEQTAHLFCELLAQLAGELSLPATTPTDRASGAGAGHT
jgi:hypothetical protein